MQMKHDLRVIDVADILFVQSGFIGSRKLEACKEKIDPTNVISIFYKNMKTIDFLVDGDEERGAVLSAIQTIRNAYHNRKTNGSVGKLELLLRYTW